MKVKYIRVSTLDQNTERQQINSNKFQSLYIDKISGAIPFFERQQGKKLTNDIINNKVDEVHVSSIDRMGRNILDILIVSEFFNQNGVNLYVENIGMYSMVNSKPNPIFKMIISVLGNVAEMERTNMLERQRQGIEIAKAKGKYTGRLYGVAMSNEIFLKKYKKVKQELENGESLRRAAKLGECSLGTAQKVKRLISA
ncbi:recombinase family protein [Cellulophaga sp. E16_2]|uniref:recombinase family protein n=1 Tax=Cellulophaga sp. E16_2 TaxID=2789297 RepID=UPI001A923330|nr:recombinase family protein [Cellulophaga sp. E16_2]MBO0593116.1 recombinase family protein [Cellulophaga sp. E16_2]